MKKVDDHQDIKRRTQNQPVVVLDAGHGGWDKGAAYRGRLEKDDNLRLALEIQKQLGAQCVEVLMTRDADMFISLEERSAMANSAGADLFVSLHRNSYIEQTASAKGVENFIYLTAPAETSGKAARYVIDQVAEVGVQSSRGVKRGDYSVLRRSKMPAMLLEMGYIINDKDNQLFDARLKEYAAAVTKGIMRYFGLNYIENQDACPLPSTNKIKEVQKMINNWFGLQMGESGVFDAATKKDAVIALQMALDTDFNTNLKIDGILGPITLAAFPGVYSGHRGNVAFVIQALLQLNGYDPGNLDGGFGPATKKAVERFQKDRGLSADGIAGRQTLKKLLDA